jgi:hypothetical protein
MLNGCLIDRGKSRIGESGNWRGIGERGSSRQGTNVNSTRAFELTRRVAGNVIPVYAGFAYINALTETLCIKILVSLRDASTLLI